MKKLFAIFFLAVIPLSAEAPPRGWAARSPLVANAYSQEIQNDRADAYHLSRMTNRAMIARFYRAGYLDAVPIRTSYYYLDGIAPPYRFLRPWTKLFLDRLSEEYFERFHQPLRVTSLIRTVGEQLRLARWDPNAADATGPDRSAHLTGAALDISKRFMSWQGKEWMRRVLFHLRREGFLYAIEEFEEPCFHVMVYPNYTSFVAEMKARAAVAARTGHSVRLHRAAAADRNERAGSAARPRP
jgi:hypothetical protein